VIAIPLMECLAAIAILAYFSRDRHGMPAWRVIVAPIVAAVLLALVTVLIISQLDVFTTRGLVVNAILVGVVFAALIVGILRALWLRARNPDVYQGLGNSNPFAQ
jgi:RsiW-degrading membrane proteinase PrsW (M82 family)